METYLVTEIAMDGDTGVTFQRFSDFISAYYRDHVDAHIPPQLVDDAFVDYTWRNLLQTRGDLRVGYVQNRAVADVPQLSQDEQDEGEPSSSKRKPKSLKGKGRTILLGSGRKKDSHIEFVELESEKSQLPRKALSEKYGDDLRIAASPEACWVALTGSHERPNRLTRFVFAVLESIARKRENGLTMVELGHEYVHDQKSLFHFVKQLTELNIVAKIRACFFDPVKQGNIHTSRMIHRRYLSTSKHWRVSAEAAAEEQAAREPPIDAGIDDIPSTVADPSTWRPLTKEHFYTNANVVLNRIKFVLRRAPGFILPHTDIIHAVKLTDTSPKQRKMLNRVIDKLCLEGELEKVSAASEGKDKDSQIQCVRLVKAFTKEQKAEENANPGSFESQLGTRADLPMDWQVADLLFAAGPTGMTLKELGNALSIIDLRGLESVVLRLENTVAPPHLADYAFRSVIETAGRIKSMRWFSVPGYRERCRRDGIPMPEAAEPIHDETVIGGFSATRRRHFRTMDELEGAVVLANSGKSSGSRKPAKMKKAETPMASTSAVTIEALQDRSAHAPPLSKKRRTAKIDAASVPGQTTAGPTDAIQSNIAEIAVPKRRGRPRKEPGAPKSQYQRKRHADGSFVKRPPDSKLTPEERQVLQSAENTRQDPDASEEPPKKRQRGIPVIHDSEEDETLVAPALPRAARSQPELSASRSTIDVAGEETEMADQTASISEMEIDVQAKLSTTAVDDDEHDDAAAVAAAVTPTQMALEAESESRTAGGAMDSEADYGKAVLRTSAEHVKPASDARGSRAARIPHTQVVRESELVALIKRKGGIVIDCPQLRAEHQQYVRDTKGHEAAPNIIDKLSMNRIVKAMVSRAVMQRSVVTVESFTGGSIRYNVLYLPEVDFDSQQMRSFLDSLSGKTLMNDSSSSWAGKRPKLDTPVRQKNPPKARSSLDALTATSDDEVRAYFSKQWRVVAYSYGWASGRLARSRLLHEWLTEWLISQAEPDKFTISSDTLLANLPIGLYIRLLPVTAEDDQLTVFLADPANAATLCHQLPDQLRKSLQIGKLKSRERMSGIIEVLCTLRLVKPMRQVPQTDPLEPSGTDLQECSLEEATCYCINRTMPIYQLSRKTPPRALIEVIELETLGSCSRYWEALRKACLQRDNEVGQLQTSGNVPDVFPGDDKFCRDASNVAHWDDGPKLQPEQLDWLKQDMGDRNVEDITGDDALLSRWSHVLLADCARIVESLKKLSRESHRIKYSRRRKASAVGQAVEEANWPQHRSDLATDGAPALAPIEATPAQDLETREKECNTIIRRYEANAGRLLDHDVASMLKGWFMSDGTERLSAAQLEQHLERFLGYRGQHESIPTAPPSTSLAISSSPRSLTNAQSARGAKSVESSRTPHRSVVQPRFRWNNVTSELLRDAYAVTNSRANRLSCDLSWDKVATAFPQRTTNQVRQHARVLLGRTQEVQYLRALETAWLELWGRDVENGTLIDQNTQSPVDFDLDAHVAHLKQRIDKSKMRSADFLTSSEDEVDLPVDIADISSRWLVERHEKRIAREEETALGNYWAGAGTTAKDRVGGIGAIAFSTAETLAEHSDPVRPSTNILVAHASMACKMVLSMPFDANNQAKITMLMKQVDSEAGFSHLSELGMTRRTGSGGKHRRPEYSEKFRGLLDAANLGVIHELARTLRENTRSCPWPLLLEDWQMVALTQGFHQGHLTFDIDTTLVSDALLEIGFNARKGDDETIENTLTLRTSGTPNNSPTYLGPPTTWKGTLVQRAANGHGLNVFQEPATCIQLTTSAINKPSYADCTACLSEAVQRVKAQALPIDAACIDMLLHTDVASRESWQGISGQELRKRCKTFGIDAPDRLFSALVGSRPPIFFWAGDDDPRLIWSGQLTHWTVTIPTSDGKQRQRMFPRMWLDVDGNVVSSMWTSCLRCVLKVMADHPGLSESAIYAKLAPAFERLELADVLQHLLDTNCIIRKSKDNEVMAYGDFIAVEAAHYFLAADFLW